jgi:transcriptional regulator with XRE-family HTH domain
MRKKRLQLGLFQREVAQLLGVDPGTVLNWEKGRTEPPMMAMRAILGFLGYDPFPPSESLAERLLAKRREMGWSIEEAARLAHVDPGTWANWEHGGMPLFRRHRARIAKRLDCTLDALDKKMTERSSGSHGGNP